MQEGRQDLGDLIAEGVGSKDAAQSAAERQDRQYAAESEAPAVDGEPEEQVGARRRGSLDSLLALLAGVGAAAGDMPSRRPTQPHEDPEIEAMFQAARLHNTNVWSPISKELSQLSAAVGEAFADRDLAAFTVAISKQRDLARKYLWASEQAVTIVEAGKVSEEAKELVLVHQEIAKAKRELRDLGAKAAAAMKGAVEFVEAEAEQAGKRDGTPEAVKTAAQYAGFGRQFAEASASILKTEQRLMELTRKHDRLAVSTGLCKPTTDEAE